MIETIYLGTDEIRAGDGKFRSSYRYLRASSSSLFPIAKGETIFVNTTSRQVILRYAVGSYATQTNTWSTTVTASVQNVTL